MSKPFVVACKQYFGLRDGQSLSEFKAEVDQLTAKDAADMLPMLAAAIGDEVALPVRSAPSA